MKRWRLSNVFERIIVRNRARVISAADVCTAGVRPHASMSEPVHRETADVLYDRMVKSGESFWSAVHGPFACHDLTRARSSRAHRARPRTDAWKLPQPSDAVQHAGTGLQAI